MTYIHIHTHTCIFTSFSQSLCVCVFLLFIFSKYNIFFPSIFMCVLFINFSVSLTLKAKALRVRMPRIYYTFLPFEIVIRKQIIVCVIGRRVFYSPLCHSWLNRTTYKVCNQTHSQHINMVGCCSLFVVVFNRHASAAVWWAGMAWQTGEPTEASIWFAWQIHWNVRNAYRIKKKHCLCIR